MKGKILLTLALCLALLTITGCAQKPQTEGISVVAVIFPEYDWVRQLIGPDSNVQLHRLGDHGVDPHS